MLRYLIISVALISFAVGGTLRAATGPHAGPAPHANETWTNEDLERLRRIPDLISIVGQANEEVAPDVGLPTPSPNTQDDAWFAARAASLNARLEADQAYLSDFTQALDDARELRTTTGGVNLEEQDIGITPEATIEILQNRIRETKSRLDALEDLARREGVPPGVLREPWRYSSETGGTIAGDEPDDRGDL